MVRAACLALALALLGPAAARSQPATSEPEGLAALAAALREGEVRGKLGRLTPTSLLFAPADRRMPTVPVVALAEIPAKAVGLDLLVRGTLSEAGELRIDGYTLRLEQVTTGQALAAPSVIEELDKVRASFRERADRAIDTPTGEGPARAQVDSLQKPERDKLAEVERTASALGDRQGLCLAGELKDEIETTAKAIYGEQLENYPPWSYSTIHANAASVVALARRDATTSLCSGVVVGKNLVLTAGHCFGQDALADLDVWLDYGARKDLTLPDDRRARKIVALVAPAAERLDQQRFGPELLDYALVRFEDGAGVAPPAQCLRRSSLGPGRPLYVIGYPKGTPEVVHDSSYVYLPYKVSETTRNLLHLDVVRGPCSRLLAAIVAEDADKRERALDDMRRISREFFDSYQLVETSPGVGSYFLKTLGTPELAADGHPKLGIVSDTFGGDSGAPVFDREGDLKGNHCVTAVFLGGQPDTGTRLGASWARHEVALPVGVILDDLERDPTLWQALQAELKLR